MKLWQMMMLGLYSLGLATGQMLFKRAALHLNDRGDTGMLEAAVRSPSLWLAITLYGLLTAFWVYILTLVPLARAYPFIAVTFVVTPLWGGWLFGETVGPLFYLGLATVLLGLGLIFFDGMHT